MIIFGIRTITIYDLLKKQVEIGKSFYLSVVLILLEAVDWKVEWAINQKSELWWVGDYILMICD